MSMRCVLILVTSILFVTGCATQGKTGAAIGSGIGALAGNLIDGKQLSISTGAATGRARAPRPP